jgi:hypothetical protein
MATHQVAELGPMPPEFDTKTPILPFKRCRLDINQQLTCAIGEVL